MKSTVAAATAFALAMAATTASAGVVISQDLVAGTGATSQQTMMIQGHKQKVVGADITTITDLDAGTVSVLFTKYKHVVPVHFPPTGVFASGLALYKLAVPFKKTGTTHEVAGYQCQDYAGNTGAGSMVLHATECVSTEAPGAKEYSEYQKLMMVKAKAKVRGATGQLPDGIPLLETSARMPIPFSPAPGISPEIAAKIQARMAQNKPITTSITVSKIEVKDLPADTFTVSADYKKTEVSVPHIATTHDGKVVAPGTVPAQPGSSTNPGASAAPAAPAAAASH